MAHARKSTGTIKVLSDGITYHFNPARVADVRIHSTSLRHPSFLRGKAEMYCKTYGIEIRNRAAELFKTTTFPEHQRFTQCIIEGCNDFSSLVIFLRVRGCEKVIEDKVERAVSQLSEGSFLLEIALHRLDAWEPVTPPPRAKERVYGQPKLQFVGLPKPTSAIGKIMSRPPPLSAMDRYRSVIRGILDDYGFLAGRVRQLLTDHSLDPLDHPAIEEDFRRELNAEHQLLLRESSLSPPTPEEIETITLSPQEEYELSQIFNSPGIIQSQQEAIEREEEVVLAAESPTQCEPTQAVDGDDE